MAQAMAEDLGRTPMSPALQATLKRARDYASGQSHAQVTVEHLLLALSEDEDAALVLQSSRVDIGRLRNDIAGYLGSLGDRAVGPTQPVVSSQLAEILKYATLAAKQGRRAKIDGAIVLAALVGDGRSMAASFLNAQGLTFEEAIRVLQRAAPPAAVAGRAPVSSRNGANAEDILAAARERVEQRTIPPRVEIVVSPASRPPASQPEDPTLPRSTPADGGRNATAASPNREAASDQALAEPNPIGQSPVALAAADPGFPAQSVSSPSPDAGISPAEHTPPFAAGHAVMESRQPQPALAAALATSTMPFPPPPSQAPHARAPSTTWAPPPLPLPAPMPQPSQARMPPPVQNLVRPAPSPNGASSPERSFRPEPAAQAPWADAAPRQPIAQPYPAMPPPSAALQHGGMFPAHHKAPHVAGAQLRPSTAPVGVSAETARAPAIEAAQVSHNAPKSLRLGKTAIVEVRVARAAIAGGSAGPRPLSLRAELVSVRAISVRLRGVKSAFAIDAGSPETQWDQATGPAGRLTGETAVWRFSVSPLKAGRGDLHLVVAARTVGADGLIADTVLPDQAVTIRISRDIGKSLRRAGLAIGIAVASIAIEKIAEGVFKFDLFEIASRLMGL